MMQRDGRRAGRAGGRWGPGAGWGQRRADLLDALDAYRRGVAEAPVVCKWGVVAPAAAAAVGDGAGVSYRASVTEDGGGATVGRNAGGGPAQSGGALTFVASTGEVDRHGDIVSPDGWRLDEYRRNPVLLWAHDYRQPAIGLSEAVWSDGRALLARMQFAPTEFAQEVAGLYRQGFQRGVSVGFRPVRFEERRDARSGAFLGIRFLEQELLEISAVPVPANSHALLRGGAGSVNYAVTDAVRDAARESPKAAMVVALLRELRR